MAALVSKLLPKDFYLRTLWSRLIFLLLQVCFNFFIPDHEANVYQSPLKPSSEEFGLIDRVVEFFLNGFTRWDGQYFLHISLLGYTHENCLAFFPLLPFITRFGAVLVKLLFFANISDWHASVLSCFIINITAFLIASKYLYLLTIDIVGSKGFATRTWQFFCVSPATVFFLASYSESLFSAFTFSGIFFCKERRYLTASILFGLSGATRSNGTLNLGFLAFFMCAKLIVHGKIKTNIFKLASMLPLFLIAILPFVSYQLYAFIIFCYISDASKSFPVKLTEFINKEGLLASGTVAPSWCDNTVPFSYSSIQERYWNVGFLRYFELKQAPNFLLALPVMSLVLCYSLIFLMKCPQLHFISSSKRSIEAKIHPLFEGKNCAFVCHASFLAVFTFLCAHVQISTRLIGSSSPVIYWFMTWLTEEESSIRKRDSHNAPLPFPFPGATTCGKLVCYYCYTYVLLGLLMFPNFLPWT